MSHRPLLIPPHGVKQILLHTCCAPCSGEIIETLLYSNIPFTIFFYNPNIHPFDEYEVRKNENKRFAEKHHIPFIEADYEVDNWFTRIRGLENEPERGKRCTTCFDIRLERTALYAYEQGFTAFTSSLGISRWKNLEQINDSGYRAASRYPDLVYWDFNWRKHGGSQRTVELAKRENFYRQNYCGCVYSMRKEYNRSKIG